MAKASEKTILIVDDEPDVRNFLAAFIGDAGFQVETAVDGIDALEKVEVVNPDLMTLDMVMPKQSGVRTLRILREKEKWADLPVIVITAHAHDEFGSEDVKLINAFASGHRPRYTMEKPVTPEKLVNAICEILEVEAEEAPIAPLNETDQIKNLISNSDPETLAKIRSLLNGGN
jgi:CheY-like chemotaxis protein